MSTQFADKIILLKRKQWQGHCLHFSYVAHNYYDVEIVRSKDDFHISFVKKPFVEPYEHSEDDTDKLFAPWMFNVKAWGVVEDGKLIAVIETAVEVWNNRLRVSELWIDTAYRRQGLGTALMDIAVKRAKKEKRRAIVLETQTCNEAAVAFYLKYGFTLIGFDSCDYHNDDIERKEVHLELGILFEQN